MTLTSHLVSARERGKRMLSQTRLNASRIYVLTSILDLRIEVLVVDWQHLVQVSSQVLEADKSEAGRSSSW